MILFLLPYLGIFHSKASYWFFLFAHVLNEESVLQSNLDLQRKHWAALDSMFHPSGRHSNPPSLGLWLLSVTPSSRILTNSNSSGPEPAPESLSCISFQLHMQWGQAGSLKTCCDRSVYTTGISKLHESQLKNKPGDQGIKHLLEHH